MTLSSPLYPRGCSVLFTCPLALPQRFVLQVCCLLATVPESPTTLLSVSFQNAGDGAAAGGAARGGTAHPPTNGFREFSCCAALLRNSCLSKNQCFKSVVYLFVYVLINLCASSLSLRACRAPHPGVGHLVSCGFDNASLCFQRDPEGQWAQPSHRVQYPDAL